MLNQNIRTSSSLEVFRLVTLLLSTVFAFSANAQSTFLQKAIEEQKQRLTSANDEDRRDALMRLGAMRSAEASRAALPGLNDQVPMVRAVAANAVRWLPATESVAALQPLLSDKDEFVRREVTYALGHTKSHQATAALIERLQTDKDDSVKAAAAVALGEIGDESAVIPLSTLLAPEPSSSKAKREKNVFVLRAAAESLGMIRSKAGVPALVAALGNAKYDSDIRREAARSLGRIGDPSSIAALQSVTSSTDPYLANTAVEALKTVHQ